MPPHVAPSNRLSKILWRIVGAVLCLAVVALWNPVQISYHQREILRLKQLISTSGGSAEMKAVMESLQPHLQRLVALGAIERRVIELKQIKTPSPAVFQMLIDLTLKRVRCRWFRLANYESGSLAIIEVWGTAEEIREFQQTVENQEAALWNERRGEPEYFDSALSQGQENEQREVDL